MKTGWVVIPALIVPAPAFATQYLTVEQAQRALFPSADRFEPRDLALTDAALHEVEVAHPAPVARPRPSSFAADRAGAVLGYVYVDEVLGKQLYITYAVGIDTAGTVVGVEILEYRETHGYEVRNAAWRGQFAGRTAAAPPSFGTNVKNISGATLSSRHVTEGVARVLAIHALSGH
jgi:Na+-translocating ferredoxin:NAD+ oxidoreductase RnfG subunit